MKGRFPAWPLAACWTAAGSLAVMSAEPVQPPSTVATAPATAAPAAAPNPVEMPVEVAIRQVTTPMPRRDDSYARQHAAFVAQARERGASIRVLLIGDSITAGWTAAGTAVWQEQLAPRGAAHIGIPGDMVQFLLARLSDGELAGLSPAVTILMIGTNNLKSGNTRMPPVAVATGVEVVLVRLRQLLPETRLVLCSILPRQTTRYPWIGQVVRDTNVLLRDLAGQHDATWLDLHDRFLDAGGHADQALMPDLVHPNAAGYRLWSEALAPHLPPIATP